MPHLRPQRHKLRIALSTYDPKSSNYKPLKGKALIIPLDDALDRHVFFEELKAWLESDAWRNKIPPRGPGAEAARAAHEAANAVPIDE